MMARKANKASAKLDESLAGDWIINGFLLILEDMSDILARMCAEPGSVGCIC